MSFDCDIGRWSWPSIQAHLEKGEDLLVLPCGATEQHGPHLPVNTDSVIADGVCDYACRKAQVPKLPVLSYTVSVGHTSKWPGTFSLSHETFISTLIDLVDWAVATGWKRLLLVNSHFGNDASLRVAVDRVRTARMGEFQIGWRHTFSLTSEIWDYFVGDAEDLHANRAETDLMLHLAPDTVDMSAAEDDPDRTSNLVFSYPVAQTSRQGVTGCPSMGSSRAGARLFQQMGDALAQILELARFEKPPLDVVSAN